MSPEGPAEGGAKPGEAGGPPAGRPDLDRIFNITGDELPPEVQEARQDPSLIFGKYILLEMLGKGGTGYVRKAWDTMLGQLVALKFLSRRESPGKATSAGAKGETDRIRDLLQEARLAARLRHSHIVSVFDVGCIGTKFYVAMQYIRGKNLLEHVAASRERGWPSPLYADPACYLGLLCDIAGAIEYAHAFSPPIIHCDLKPSNVIVSAEGAAFVVDFGLARVAGASKVEDIGVRGTPEYMAPEQVAGQASGLGVWTDIYGIGGLIYVLLTGRPPIQGVTADLQALIARKPPERPSVLLRAGPEYAEQMRNHALMPHVSRLEEICMKCLAKRPEDRYRMASRIAGEIRAVLNALRGGGPSGAEEKKAAAASSDPTASQQLLFKGLDPSRVVRLLRDKPGQEALIEAFRSRLAERLNRNFPRVMEYPLPGGAAGEVRVLKVTPARLYRVCRGEVETEEWPALDPDRLIALAEAAGAGEPDDRLALGFLKIRAGARESAAGEDGSPRVSVSEGPALDLAPEPPRKDDDAPLELL